MDLYILRHGKAQDHGLAAGDFKRNLTVPGREEVEQIGRTMRDLGMSFDCIASSPLNRAMQTAQIVSKKLKAGSPAEWDELKPEGAIASLYEKLSSFKPASKILLVGHEPLLSSMIADITSGDSQAGGITLKKAGMAKITVFAARPDRVEGSLNWLLTPRLLKRMARQS